MHAMSKCLKEEKLERRDGPKPELCQLRHHISHVKSATIPQDLADKFARITIMFGRITSVGRPYAFVRLCPAQPEEHEHSDNCIMIRIRIETQTSPDRNHSPA
ncbi:hypothetical protein M758_4G242700 [Ceratodon purpureus]|nr:hypothetical protein M758_4G242700 [Ceratodon purpureus]